MSPAKKGSLGYVLRLARWESGITQKDLASEVGVTASYLSMLENGKSRIPSESLLKKLATSLNLDYLHLLSLSGAPLTPVQKLGVHLNEPTLRRAVIEMAESSTYLTDNLEGVTLYFPPPSDVRSQTSGDEVSFLRTEGHWVSVNFDLNSAAGLRARRVERLCRSNSECRPDTFEPGDDE